MAAKTRRMGPKLKKRLDKFHAAAASDAIGPERADAEVERLTRERIDGSVATEEFTTERAAVGRFTPDEIESSVATEEFVSERTAVGRLDSRELRRREHRDKALEKRRALEAAVMKKRQDAAEHLALGSRIEALMRRTVEKVIGGKEWDKAKVPEWMQQITTELNDIWLEVLPDGAVFKFTVDCILLKATAVATQNDSFYIPDTDFKFNLKIKSGKGLTAIVNAYAFHIGDFED